MTKQRVGQVKASQLKEGHTLRLWSWPHNKDLDVRVTKVEPDDKGSIKVTVADGRAETFGINEVLDIYGLPSD